MKTLLIPVDFESSSNKALEVGASIAKRLSAKIVLTHMVGNRAGISKNSSGFEEMHFHVKRAEKQYAELLKQPFLNGVLVEPLLQKDVDFDSINDLAKDLGVELIVMGSEGSRGLQEVFKGSNAEKVVRNSEVPVLIIKENNLNFAPERLIFASNFKDEAVAAYYKIIEIATLLKVQMELLFINLPGEQFVSTKEMDERLLEFFNKVSHPEPVKAIKTVNRYADYNVEQGIFNFASLSGADIIAIPTHGRKGLMHWVHGSIGEDIANHSILPVLTVKI